MNISIIVPTFNEEQYLPLLLSDIREQSHQPHEVIVADAQSTDATREIAESFQAHVIDGGLPGVGRNAGAKVATGELLIFFDADVRLPNVDYLRDCVYEFKQRNLDLATCDVSPLEDTAINQLMLKTYNAYTRLTERVKAHAPGFCIFVKRSIHQEIDGFDEEVLLAEDHDYVQRASRIGSFGVLRAWPIVTSTRRLNKDGRLKTIAKYIACELHMSTLGPVKHDFFKYRFGYSDGEDTQSPLERLLKSPKKLSKQIERFFKEATDKLKQNK